MSWQASDSRTRRSDDILFLPASAKVAAAHPKRCRRRPGHDRPAAVEYSQVAANRERARLPWLASRADAGEGVADLPTVVLVHGAWADGSSWNPVISRLQKRGLKVISVQNPLSSLADDVGAVKRVVEAQSGPVVLVGHSWGGTVITEAGNAENVVALVYVAALAPDKGESTNDLLKNDPPPGYLSQLQPDSAGYLRFPGDALPGLFAQDLSLAEGKVLAATQTPIRGSTFGGPVSAAAWRTKPSWYLLTDADRMIYPSLQQRMAERINARVTTVHASHVPFLSKPRQTTAVILEAVDQSARKLATHGSQGSTASEARP